MGIADCQSFLFVVVQENVVQNTLLHSSIVVENHSVDVLLDNFIDRVRVQRNKVLLLLLEGLDLGEGQDVANDVVSPISLDVGHAARIDLILQVSAVPLIHLLLPKDFRLQLLLFFIAQGGCGFVSTLICQQNRPVIDLLLLTCDRFEKLLGRLK